MKTPGLPGHSIPFRWLVCEPRCATSNVQLGMETMKRVTIHTDGACSRNPGPGGYGAVLQFGQHRRELSGGFAETTNNRMELLAVIVGLEALIEPSEVTVCSDSRYIVDAVNKGWAQRWRTNGWQRNKKDRAVNPDLWGRLLDLLEHHDVEFEWVRGHAGNPGNERADALAVAASRSVDLAVDEGYVDGQTSAVATPAQPDPAISEELAIPDDETRLTHIDPSGKAQMVDVGWKPETQREAVARGRVVMRPETLALIQANSFEKGDVLGVARIAGIMGAKNTSQLIPLCHPLPIDRIAVDFELDTEHSAVEITATARTTGKTGVEMEALTAVSIAALTIYDMCKAVDRAIRIEDIRLVRKTGGQSGDVILEAE